MAAGYEISASDSSNADSATGAVQFGKQGGINLTGVVGGSNGLSVTTVALLVGALVAIWYFFLRKGGK